MDNAPSYPQSYTQIHQYQRSHRVEKCGQSYPQSTMFRHVHVDAAHAAHMTPIQYLSWKSANKPVNSSAAIARTMCGISRCTPSAHRISICRGRWIRSRVGRRLGPNCPNGRIPTASSTLPTCRWSNVHRNRPPATKPSWRRGSWHRTEPPRSPMPQHMPSPNNPTNPRYPRRPPTLPPPPHVVVD